MPCEAFITKRFSAEHLRLIQIANEILTEYARMNLVLTLRQLYYQFVARDHIANTVENYKKLGKVISNGRKAGMIDWEAIEDRTRNLAKNSHWSSPAEIVDICAKTFRYDLWDNQSTRVEVWIEKEALVGVIESVCRTNDVPYFACRGYVSDSEAWRAGKRFAEYLDRGHDNVVVLHLGDHDPSGIGMTGDNQGRLNLFASEVDERIEVRRLALNMDQVRRYRPPPNPAKEADPRFKDYEAKFGTKSWELDALDPRVIQDLIETEIDDLRDEGAWAEAMARQKKARERLAKIATTLKKEKDE